MSISFSGAGNRISHSKTHSSKTGTSGGSIIQTKPVKSSVSSSIRLPSIKVTSKVGKPPKKREVDSSKSTKSVKITSGHKSKPWTFTQRQVRSTRYVPIPDDLPSSGRPVEGLEGVQFHEMDPSTQKPDILKEAPKTARSGRSTRSEKSSLPDIGPTSKKRSKSRPRIPRPRPHHRSEHSGTRARSTGPMRITKGGVVPARGEGQDAKEGHRGRGSTSSTPAPAPIPITSTIRLYPTQPMWPLPTPSPRADQLIVSRYGVVNASKLRAFERKLRQACTRVGKPFGPIVSFRGGYPDFKRQFVSRGWAVADDSNCKDASIRFTIRTQDSDFSGHPWQWVNHFPQCVVLTMKSGLITTLKDNPTDLDPLVYYPVAFRLDYSGPATTSKSVSSRRAGGSGEKITMSSQATSLDLADLIEFKESFSKLQVRRVLRSFLEDELTSPCQNLVFLALLFAKRQAALISHVDLSSLKRKKIKKEDLSFTNCPLPLSFEEVDYRTLFSPLDTSSVHISPRLLASPYSYLLKNASESEIKQESTQLLDFLRQRDLQRTLEGEMCNAWVVKPAGKSRGRGIFVSNQFYDIVDTIRASQDRWIVQRYIERPLLIHGYKFDIRQWVLVSSLNPLIIWQYEEPYVRFCSYKYSLNQSQLSDPFVHLTNNSIQKKAEKFGADSLLGEGNMWPYAQLADYMAGLRPDPSLLVSRLDGASFPTVGERVMHDMGKIIISTVHAARFDLKGTTCTSSPFELFGYDFMIDEHLQVWLIEVNASPTLEHATPLVTTLIDNMSKGLVGIMVEGQSGVKVKTDGKSMFPSIRPASTSLYPDTDIPPMGTPEWLGGWQLIYKERHAVTTGASRGLDLTVRGDEVSIPQLYIAPTRELDPRRADE
eukprot:gnl/Dysnectes_brevis/4054_a5310_505.p1 GENE.gnl/Dysnectes_brevis/4054_a5310_505~~gnl/Dysnectes_brevis/4054_a5310_505.p1  ORF type:complete len:880 (-),score=145.63 gnl/Dysnectes_brevis/4054_a5310_505:104-2743(-)